MAEGQETEIIKWIGLSVSCKNASLLHGPYGKPQPDCLSDGNQRGEPRVTVLRQSSIEALTLDTSGLGNFGDTLSLGEMT